MASIISFVVSGSFASPRTLAAASSALAFFDLGSLAAGFFVAGVAVLAAGFLVPVFFVAGFFFVVFFFVAIVQSSIVRETSVARRERRERAGHQLPRAAQIIQLNLPDCLQIPKDSPVSPDYLLKG